MGRLKLNILLTILSILKLCMTSKTDYALLSRDTLKDNYGPIVYAGLVFRHGHRAPNRKYPTDPHKSHPWPLGFEQLINEGKVREHELGKYFKPRYTSITGASYHPTKVVMDASGYDRTLMSGELFYLGYYPPTEQEIWNSEILWQPIPVHSTPKNIDYVIAQSKACPLLDKAKKRFYSTNQAIKNICNTNKQTYDTVGKFSGLNTTPCESLDSSENIIGIQDTLMIQKEHDLKLPDWTESIFPQPLTYLRYFLFEISVEDLTISRLLAGPMLNVFASDMLNIIGWSNTLPRNLYTRTPEETRPLHLMSGHDNNLTRLMRALKVYDNELPPLYGAALGFELRHKDNEYYVSIVYEHALDAPLKILSIPECIEICTLQEFLALITPLIPQDWDAECEKEDTAATISP